MLDVLLTYDTPEPETYGEIYYQAALLLKQRGYNVSFLDIPQFAAAYDFDDTTLKGITSSLSPKIIISHQASLQRTIRTHLGRELDPEIYTALEEEIERFTLKHYQGRCQTNSHYNAPKALEFKEGFVHRMREEGIPFPLSIIRSVDVSEEQWTYQTLNQLLNQGTSQQGIIVKDITESKGQGIYFLQDESLDVLTDRNIRIAQRRILNDTLFPCSLRFVTFPGRIIGTFLYYSKTDAYRSNLPGHYNKIVISPKNIAQLKKDDPQVFSQLPQNGFTRNSEVKEDIIDLATRVSALSSQSLLRGIDIIFDGDGNPYVLEAQTNPGYSWSTNYPLMAGLEPGEKSHNLAIAAWIIAHQLSLHLQKI